MNDKTGVYIISIASQITGLHPQTLRQYDRIGLVTPTRSGRYRLYSQHDLHKLQRIQQLSNAGINLAGIIHILELENQIEKLKQRLKTPAP